MRKIFNIILIFQFLTITVLIAQNQNVALIGRWAKGPCEAIYYWEGFTFVGQGGYLDVYHQTLGFRDRLLLDGPVLDIWAQTDMSGGKHANVYIACGTIGLQVAYFDYEDQEFKTGTKGKIIGKLNTEGYATGVQHKGNYIYMADGSGGLVIIDIATGGAKPSNPILKAILPLEGYSHAVNVVNDTTVLVAAGNAGLYSITVANRSQPEVLHSLNFNQDLQNVQETFLEGTLVYVAAGFAGMRIVDVQDPTTLQELGDWSGINVEVLDVVVTGDYGFMACGSNGFFAHINITDPTNPTGPSFPELNTAGYTSGVVVHGDTAHIADGNNGYLLVNIQEGFKPSIIETIETADQTYDVDITNTYLYSAVGKSGLKIFDLEAIEAPDLISDYNTPGEAYGVQKVGTKTFIADGSQGLVVVSVLNPTNPVFNGQFIPENSTDACFGLDVPAGRYGYLACGYDGVRMVDISDLNQIREAYHVDTPGRALDVRISGNYLYIADSSSVLIYSISGETLSYMKVLDNNVEALGIDVANDTVYIANGQYGALIWDPHTNSVERIDLGDDCYCTDILVNGKTIFVTDSEKGLQIFDSSIPGTFIEVGSHQTGGNASRMDVDVTKIAIADGPDGLYFLESEIKPQIELLIPGIKPGGVNRINFGPVPKGESRPMICYVVNTGQTLLEVEDVIINETVEDDFHFSETAFDVAPGDTFKWMITYLPTTNLEIGSKWTTTATISWNHGPDQTDLGLTLQWEGGYVTTTDPYSPDGITSVLYHFNQSTGTSNLVDASFNYLNGQIIGGPQFVASTKSGFGNMMHLDGEDDRIAVAFDSVMNFQWYPFTLEMWFQLLTKPETYYILAKRGIGSTLQYELAIASDITPEKGIMARVQDENGVLHTISTGSLKEININQWYHAALTWDGDSLRLLVNGTPVAKKHLKNQLKQSNADLGIGASVNGNAPFHGYIDEFRISQLARQSWEFNVNQSRLAVSESNIDFGQILPFRSRSLPLTIKNNGKDELTVTWIQSTSERITIQDDLGEPFAVFSLGANQEKRYWLTFYTEVKEVIDATLLIQSTDLTYPTYNLSLDGECVTSLPTGGYSPDPFTLGLYHFDKVSSTTIYDSSGYGLTGTLDGNVSKEASGGRFETGFYLQLNTNVGQTPDGIAIINIPKSVPMTPRWGGFTVETWFSLQSDIESSWERMSLVSRKNDSLAQFILAIEKIGGNPVITGTVYNQEGTPTSVTSADLGEIIKIGQWYNVAIILLRDTLKLSVNGEVTDENLFIGQMAGSEENSFDGNLPILIGNNFDFTAPFYGGMDEVRISNIGRQSWEFNVNQPRLYISHQKLNFGEVPLGIQQTRKLWLKNTGIDTLKVTSISISEPSYFSVEASQFTLLPGESRNLEITFRPLEVEEYQAVMAIESNDPFYPIQLIYLEGSGNEFIPPGTYSVDSVTTALFHFEQDSGSTIMNALPGGVVGNIQGSYVWSDSGRFGRALRLDSCLVQFAPDSLFNFAGRDFTIEFWFSIRYKPKGSSILFKRGNQDTNQIELSLTSNGLLGIVWDSEGNADTLQTGSLKELDKNTWYHVAFIWDGDSTFLYLNNILKDRHFQSANLRDVALLPIILGAHPSGSTQMFYGYFDEMRISEIARLNWEFNVIARKLFVDHTSINFSSVVHGSSRTLWLYIQNLGDQNLNVNISGLENQSIFSIPYSSTNFTLKRLETSTIPVKFLPDTSGITYRDTLNISSNDPENPYWTVTISGRGEELRERTEYVSDAHTFSLYHFNTASDTMMDVSGNGYYAVLHRGVSWSQEGGYFGGGLYFNGHNGRVAIDSSFVKNLFNQSFSIECYFKTDTTSQTLISRGFEDYSSNHIDMGLYINNKGLLKIIRFGIEFIAGTQWLSDNSWHHVALTYNRISTTAKGYIDGDEVLSEILNISGYQFSSRPLILGCIELSKNYHDQFFQGYMDEVRLSTIARESWEFELIDYGVEISMASDTLIYNQDNLMNIIIPSQFQIDHLICHYRNGGSNTYQQIVETQVADTTQITLPDTIIDLRGFEYYIEMRRGAESFTKPVLDPENNPLTKIVRFQNGDVVVPVQLIAQQYKMVSIPYQLDITTLDSVLIDDLGDYNPYKWRIFWYHRNSGRYKDYNEDATLFRFDPGRAFWVITDTDQTFDIGDGNTVSTDFSYQIPILLREYFDPTDSTIKIAPGWNMISTPYNFSVLWEDCTISDSLTGLYYWDGESYRMNWERLEPWEGYFICNQGIEPVTLFVNPKEAPPIDQVAPAKGLKTNDLTCSIRLEEKEWMYRFSASTKKVKDLDNFAGIRFNAKGGWDMKDSPEPPTVGEQFSLCFEHPDWERYAGSYAADFRNPNEEGYIWNLSIKSEITNEFVILTWQRYNQLPDGWEAYIFDLQDGVSVNLENESKHKIKTHKNTPNLRSFKLIVGSRQFIEGHRGEIPLEPIVFQLNQNFPNPFNPETLIRFSLPKKDKVKMTIFNILGQQVRILKDGVMIAGHHQILWNGKDAGGHAVSSGIYVYRLETSDHIKTKKMTLIR